jgi:hypothetical protein
MVASAVLSWNFSFTLSARLGDPFLGPLADRFRLKARLPSLPLGAATVPLALPLAPGVAERRQGDNPHCCQTLQVVN